jgi:two-component system, chemotaxis family, chemotaxis protein CheY
LAGRRAPGASRPTKPAPKNRRQKIGAIKSAPENRRQKTGQGERRGTDRGARERGGCGNQPVTLCLHIAAETDFTGTVSAMVVPAHTSVLVVDDSKTMIRIVCNLLRQIGFSMIDEAADGNGALDLMQTKSYGVVISDWNMEPMTGLKLLQHVRADERLKRTPFIMVTAESAVDNVIAAKKAGVNDYIVKPFNAETLKSKLVSVLGHF